MSERNMRRINYNSFITCIIINAKHYSMIDNSCTLFSNNLEVQSKIIMATTVVFFLRLLHLDICSLSLDWAQGFSIWKTKINENGNRNAEEKQKQTITSTHFTDARGVTSHSSQCVYCTVNSVSHCTGEQLLNRKLMHIRGILLLMQITSHVCQKDQRVYIYVELSLYGQFVRILPSSRFSTYDYYKV